MKYSKSYWDDVSKVTEVIPNIMALKNSKILITGAAGMICSAVAEILFYLNENDAGNIIYLAGRNKERMAERFYMMQEGKDYFFVPYDATKTVELAVKPDYIIHGASNANPSVYVEQPVETMLANLVGLNELLKVAVQTKTKKVLYVSSSEVYGQKEGNNPFVENDYGFVDILNPRACYPNAKRAAETLCVSYANEYNIDVVMVRPGHIYGPSITRSDARASAQFTWNVIDGQDILMKSAGSQLRSYCYTLDCASAILTVLLNGVNCEAYNISNKDSVVSIRDIAGQLAISGGRKIVFDNPSDAEKKGYNLMSNSSLNAEKLEALGWKACFNLEEGCKKTLEYLQ